MEEDWINETINYPSEPNSNYNEQESQIVHEIVGVLQSVPDDLYKDLFGDHCTVTIHKNGTISVDEYDHD